MNKKPIHYCFFLRRTNRFLLPELSIHCFFALRPKTVQKSNPFGHKKIMIIFHPYHHISCEPLKSIKICVYLVLLWFNTITVDIFAIIMSNVNALKSAKHYSYNLLCRVHRRICVKNLRFEKKI